MLDTHGTVGTPWIGVDLDGTLAVYNGWKGAHHIGEPIPKMLDRIKAWLAEGKKVKIFTARVWPYKHDAHECRIAICKWLKLHGIGDLEITHEKDIFMVELWDDRAVQVIPNTGLRADHKNNSIILELLNNALYAVNGSPCVEYNEELCKCDPDVGYICQYCEIHGALSYIKRVFTGC